MSETITGNLWHRVCRTSELLQFIGARALIGKQQIALFRVDKAIYAIDAFDPFSKAAVLSRGLVGDLNGQLVVASPIYKQHFNLATGVCLEDESVRVATYAVRETNGYIEINCTQPKELAEPMLEVAV